MRGPCPPRGVAGPLWEDQGLIFASAAGTPLDPSSVRKAVIKAAKAAGVTGKVNPCTTRHSAASLRLDAGQPLDQVADLLGDDPRTVLLHYRHRVHPVVAVAAETPRRGPCNGFIRWTASKALYNFLVHGKNRIAG